MKLKVTFINPNTEKDVDKYLPKILAEAVINMIARERNEVNSDNDYEEKHSA